MSELDNEKRYQEIMRRIAENQDSQPVVDTNPLKAILNNLNIWDQMNTLAQQPFANLICCGPKVFEGNGWVGVLIWYRKKGYGGYQNLVVFGVWIQVTKEGREVIVGTKNLSFDAPLYNSEAYNKLIRKGFYTYYRDRGDPPRRANRVQFKTIYLPHQRIVIRRQINLLIDQQQSQMVGL